MRRTGSTRKTATGLPAHSIAKTCLPGHRLTTTAASPTNLSGKSGCRSYPSISTLRAPLTINPTRPCCRAKPNQFSRMSLWPLPGRAATKRYGQPHLAISSRKNLPWPRWKASNWGKMTSPICWRLVFQRLIMLVTRLVPTPLKHRTNTCGSTYNYRIFSISWTRKLVKASGWPFCRPITVWLIFRRFRAHTASRPM